VKALFLQILLLGYTALVAQSDKSFRVSYILSDEASISCQIKTSNYSSEYLLDIGFSLLDTNGFVLTDTIIQKYHVKQGLTSKHFEIVVPKQLIYPESKILVICNYKTSGSDSVLNSFKRNITIPIEFFEPINYADSYWVSQTNSPLGIEYKSYEIDTSGIYQKIIYKNEVTVAAYDTISIEEIIVEEPLLNQLVVIRYSINGSSKIDSLYYIDGFFNNYNRNSQEVVYLDSLKPRNLKIDGNFYLEQNSFNKAPRHSGGLIYPNTYLRSQVSVELYGIPFDFQYSYNSSEAIDQNFRNFLSFRFNADQYLKNLESNLPDRKQREELISAIEANMEKNNEVIKRLENIKQIEERYPPNFVNIDSILNANKEQLAFSDSLSIDSNLNPHYPSKTIVNNENDSINYYIDRFKQSNEQLKKRQNLLQEKNLTSLDRKTLIENSDRSVATFSRIKNFEIGNIYPYRGQYSIRDVEIKGGELEFYLLEKTSISLLYGRLNEFQALNLAQLNPNIEVKSIGINHEIEELKIGVNYLNFKDVSKLKENEGGKYEYNLFSLSSSLNLFNRLDLNFEMNTYQNTTSQTTINTDNFIEESALHGVIEYSVNKHITLDFNTDRVGKNYQSDGVYFLIKDLWQNEIGIKLRLLKNKVLVRAGHRIQERNYSNEELKNKREQQFYDLNTNFRRYPNLGITHSPMTMEIANKLDTSFSNLTANSTVTIARLYYNLKIRTTHYFASTLYNEIHFDQEDISASQRGTQNLFSIRSTNYTLSFTTAFNELYEQLRFCSISGKKKLSTKLSISLFYTHNFENQIQFYTDITRAKLNYKILKNMWSGVGSSILFSDKQSPSYGGTFNVFYSF